MKQVQSLSIFAAALLCALSVAQDGERYALLIGVNEYRSDSHLTNLKYAEADTLQIARALMECGFKPENIRVMIQGEVSDPRLKQARGSDQFKPRKANIEQQVELLLKNRNNEDTVLIAFSGHGIQFRDKEDVFYAPSDGLADDSKTLLELNGIVSQLKNSSAGAKLLIADCCRSNPFEENLRAAFSGKVESATRLHKIQPPESVAVMFSCGKGEYAREEKEFNGGVFTHYLVDGLRGKAAQNGVVEIAGLASYVQYNVYEYVRKKYSASQTPEYKLNLGRPLILARDVKPPRQSILPPEPGKIETVQTVPVVIEEEEPREGDVRRYRVINSYKQDSTIYGQNISSGVESDLRYSWQASGSERTLRFSALDLKMKHMGIDMLHSVTTRNKTINLTGGNRLEIPIAHLPADQQQAAKDTYNTPLLRVKLDATGKAIERTFLAGAGAKQVSDMGMIFGPSFFFLPYMPDQEQWQTETEIYLSDGAYAKGTLTLKKVPGGDGGQAVQISGTFTNDSFPGPQGAWTWKNAKCQLTGLQTYDSARQEWVSGQNRTVGSCTGAANGASIGSVTSTMDVKFELLDGVAESKPGVK